VAYSYVRYTGNGTTTNYAFPFPYLNQSHIFVRVNGSLVSFTFLNSSTVQLTTAPAAGTTVEVRRLTPRDTPAVDFADGSVLLESDLDLLATFNLYVAQEVSDAVEDGLFVGEDGTYGADNRRISNVANPINGQDAVTKNYLETASNSALAQAIATNNQAQALVNEATQIIGSFTISTSDPTGGTEGDVWFKVTV
jgi:hypothetical protein